MNTISQSLPDLVGKYFETICNIPRPSKKEEKIIAYLCRFAEKQQLPYKTDEAGNVLIIKPASPGFENRKTVVLQSHLDMVCEKRPTSIHNFENDPIRPLIVDGWIKADGTTLGADCGIGIAAQLAVLSSENLSHGPIECLFTVDEETGLTGAFALEPGFLKGSVLLNLDSEDEGEIFIGCAGGIDTIAKFAIEWQTVPEGYFPLEITVSDLLGGHSGDDINKGRGNAIKILVRFIRASMDKYDLRISEIQGGNLRNAIPRDASAVILVPACEKESIVADFNIFRAEISEELLLTEPSVKLHLRSTDRPVSIFSQKTAIRLINALFIVPAGVVAMSYRMPGLVETSTNLASVKTTYPEPVIVTTSQRSDRESGKRYIASIVRTVFEQAGAQVEHSDGYPGWSPNPDSEILTIAIKLYMKMYGVSPVVRSIHAGLECGLFLEKFPQLDMISFGPTITGAHSPDEKLQIESVWKFWDFLINILENIPTEE